MEFPNALNEEEYSEMMAEMLAKRHTVVKRDVKEDDQNEEEYTEKRMPAALKAIVDSKRRLLFGVGFADLSAEAYLSLAVCRKDGNPMNILWDLVFGLFVCYTVSREWAEMYNTLSNRSIYKKFEIDGRTVDATTEIGRKSAWVVGSKMNATAVHLVGYMVVESGPAGGALAKLRTQKGTCFTLVSGQSQQAKIMAQLGSEITSNDRAIQRDFAEQFAVLIRVIDGMLNEAAVSVTEALAYAKAYQPAEF